MNYIKLLVRAIWMTCEWTYASAGASSWARKLVGLTTHRKLSLGVACGLHVGKLVGTFLAEIVESSRNHHFGLATKDSIAGDFEGLKGGCAITKY